MPQAIEHIVAAFTALLATARSTTLTERQFIDLCQCEELTFLELLDTDYLENRADVWEEIIYDQDAASTSADCAQAEAWRNGECE